MFCVSHCSCHKIYIDRKLPNWLAKQTGIRHSQEQFLSHPSIHPLTHPPTHSLTYSPTHPPTHPLTHSLTHPPTHSLTDPPTHSSSIQHLKEQISRQTRLDPKHMELFYENLPYPHSPSPIPADHLPQTTVRQSHRNCTYYLSVTINCAY